MTDKQNENSSEKPWLFKPGQSGNPNGRPKGPTLKEYARSWLAGMTQEEKDKFLKELPPETVWRMAEGNPAQDNTSEVNIHVTPLLGGDSHAVLTDNSNRKAIETESTE